MQFIVTHVPMYNAGIVCLTTPINSPAALHVNFNLLQAINYIVDMHSLVMSPCSCDLIVTLLVVKLIGAWFLDSKLSTWYVSIPILAAEILDIAILLLMCIKLL